MRLYNFNVMGESYEVGVDSYGQENRCIMAHQTGSASTTRVDNMKILSIKRKTSSTTQSSICITSIAAAPYQLNNANITSSVSPENNIQCHCSEIWQKTETKWKNMNGTAADPFSVFIHIHIKTQFIHFFVHSFKIPHNSKISNS